MKQKIKEQLLFLLGLAICFAVAGVSVFLEELIPGGLLHENAPFVFSYIIL